MTAAATLEQRVLAAVARALEVPPASVTPASQLKADLHCDALDLVAIEVEIEDELGIELPEDVSDGARTVADLAAAVAKHVPTTAVDAVSLLFNVRNVTR